MKSIFTKTIITLFVFCMALSAQQPMFSIGQWKQQDIFGSLSMEGLYRSQETILASGIKETPVLAKFGGRLKLGSRSYIWHPNFLKLNINLDYNPGSQNERFLVIPNRSETQTAEQIRFQSIFFDQRPFSFNGFVNLTHNYINREYASSVEATNKDFGAGISYRNNILPVNINYLNSQWTQQELQSGREFESFRENIKLEASRSFFKNDLNRFTISYDTYSRQYASISKIENKILDIRARNSFALDKAKQNSWQSSIQYRDQKGSQQFDRLLINENIRYALPFRTKISGNYRYSGYNQALLETNQHNLLSRLEHQLFSSLTSRVYYEYINLFHTAYDESTQRAGASVRYKKKIPTGNFTVSYEHRIRSDNRDSQPVIFINDREEHSLNDDEVIFLDNPDVDVTTVSVRDETGTIIFQENIDYLLLQRESYTEIQRLPGGQITEGETVYISYSAERALAYNFTTNANVFRIGFSLFNRLLETYFRYYDQNYSNIAEADDKILKTVSQRVVGFRITKYFLTAGAEFDNYGSNLLPYRSDRYFLNMSGRILKNLNATLNGNWRKYKLTSMDEEQSFADISGQVLYLFSQNTKFRLESGYRHQQGRGMDLNLTNMRAELSTRYREIFLTAGFEMYKRDYYSEKINYNGGFIKVERKL